MPVEVLGTLIRESVAAAFGAAYAEVDPLVRRSDRADLQADVALRLARALGMQPRAVAEAIIAALPANELVDRIAVSGPGFLEVAVRDAWLADASDRALAEPRLGVPVAAQRERVVVDYSAPNVAKEMHVGHLRSTVIGDAIVRVLEFRGHEVIRQNHFGDWGTPVGMLIEHVVDLGEDAARRELAAGDLSDFYKAARLKFKDDPAFQSRARVRVVMLQRGDPWTRAWWISIVQLTTERFEAIYARLGVTLGPEHVRPESFYNDQLDPLVRELEATGQAVDSGGAACVFVPGHTNREGEPLPLIVRKRGGGFGYATTDLAALRYRIRELGATRLVYVVGAPQREHLAMIFACARTAGWLVSPVRAEHVAFGSVLDPTTKKMLRSRSGDAARLADMLDEAEASAAAVIAERAELPRDVATEAAHILAMGSIKYADLSSDRTKDYAFHVNRMVQFVGDTAGYLQYAHARVLGVFRKADAAPGRVTIVHPSEHALAIELLRFADIVSLVERTLEPHHLCGYLHGLAVAFTAMYEACPILEAPTEIRGSRLALVDLTGKILARGLDLLGIAAPERM